ncbi:hypothetical protein PSPO_a1673 [Pseudoalteromonas spongiae UST010723-006]|nr:hypothetical protein PSPO_a1673 [Pseudoalteromonas spongiae UST010723-006]
MFSIIRYLSYSFAFLNFSLIIKAITTHHQEYNDRTHT